MTHDIQYYFLSSFYQMITILHYRLTHVISPFLPLPTLSVYVTHYHSFYPPFSFPTGGWLHGLDGCITAWSHRGDEVTADLS